MYMYGLIYLCCLLQPKLALCWAPLTMASREAVAMLMGTHAALVAIRVTSWKATRRQSVPITAGHNGCLSVKVSSMNHITSYMDAMHIYHIYSYIHIYIAAFIRTVFPSSLIFNAFDNALYVDKIIGYQEIKSGVTRYYTEMWHIL